MREPGNEAKERMARMSPKGVSQEDREVQFGHTVLQVPLSKFFNCLLLYKHHRVCVIIVDNYMHTRPKVRLKHGVSLVSHLPARNSLVNKVEFLGPISKKNQTIFFSYRRHWVSCTSTW